MYNSGSVTLREYSGPSNELLARLTGKNGPWWLHRLNQFLRKENPWDVQTWEAWKTIEYGYLTTRKKLKALGNTENRSIGGYGYKVLKTLKTTEEYRKAELQVASLEELGFTKPTTLPEVNQRILELGFHLMTPELVFNLHYQHNDRPDWIYAAMEFVLLKLENIIEVVFIFGEDNGENALWGINGLTLSLKEDCEVVFVKKFL